MAIKQTKALCYCAPGANLRQQRRWDHAQGMCGSRGESNNFGQWFRAVFIERETFELALRGKYKYNGIFQKDEKSMRHRVETMLGLGTCMCADESVARWQKAGEFSRGQDSMKLAS